MTPAAPAPLNVSIVLSGEPGDGVLRAGEILMDIAARAGLSVLGERVPGYEFQGTNCSFRARIGRGAPVSSTLVPAELCIAMDAGASRLARDWMKRGCFCILDSDAGESTTEGDGRVVEWARAPLRRLALEACPSARADAFAMAGFACGLLNIKIAAELFTSLFVNNPAAADSTPFAYDATSGVRPELYIQAFDAAFRFAQGNFLARFNRALDAQAAEGVVRVTSVFDEIAQGFLRGGARRFFAARTALAGAMVSAVARELSRNADANGPRIELAETPAIAAAMALGASFGGVPGVLVLESGQIGEVAGAISSSSVAEIPMSIVVIEHDGVMANGVAGVEQSALLSSVFGGPGQSPRAVASAADHERAAELAFETIKASENYQIPAMLLVESRTAGFLARARASATNWPAPAERRRPAGMFEWSTRYGPAPSGVSPIARPGEPGYEYAANAREHDRKGAFVEPGRVREQLQQKRWRKLELLLAEWEVAPWVTNQPGDLEVENFDLVAISRGATRGAIEEAAALAAREGMRILHLQLFAIWPLPRKLLMRIRERFEEKYILVFDESPQGSVGPWLRMECGLAGVDLRRLDGTPLRATDALQRFREVFARR